MKVVFCLLLALATLVACSSDQPVGSYDVHTDAKHVSSYNPFLGLDEAGYMERLGSSDDIKTFLQILSQRLAGAMNNASLRGDLSSALSSNADREVNFAHTLMNNADLLNALKVGFKDTVAAKGISGELASDVGMEASDQTEALLAVSEGLFGLRLRLVVPENGALSWDGTSSLPVFHNSVLDEKDTQWLEGFGPDGSAMQIPFHQEHVPYALLYLHHDEDFFQRPENHPTTENVSLLHDPGTYLSWSTLGLLDFLFPAPAYAHGEHGSSSCYHNKQLKLLEIMLINDDHDPGILEGPETYTRTKLQDGDYDWNYRNENTRDDLVTVDKLDLLYRRQTSDFLPALMYRHSGEQCSGGDYYANFRVKEYDIGNPDDKVAQWRGVDARSDGIYLADNSTLPEDDPRRCNRSDGWHCDAKMEVGSW